MATPTVIRIDDHRIDYDSAPRFQSQLLDAVGEGDGALIVDLGGVESISSIGLRALVVAAKKSKTAGGKIVVTGLQPIVREVFEISRFDALFPVFDSVEAAQTALAAG